MESEHLHDKLVSGVLRSVARSSNCWQGRGTLLFVDFHVLRVLLCGVGASCHPTAVSSCVACVCQLANWR